jgi:hypothetical protein
MKKLDEQLRKSPRSYVTGVELDHLLGGTPDSRYGKIKRLLAQGKLLHIRRGLYCLTEQMGGYSTKPHPFEVAQYIYAPSYISFESALSYHGLIPEAVYVTTSASAKRSKEFKTQLGVFTYLQLPLENFYTEVELRKENNHKFFMAKPWKAICDYVYFYKKEWKNIEPLIQSLRIEYGDLPTLNYDEVKKLEEYYGSKRITRFLKGLRKDLGIDNSQ